MAPVLIALKIFMCFFYICVWKQKNQRHLKLHCGHVASDVQTSRLAHNTPAMMMETECISKLPELASR